MSLATSCVQTGFGETLLEESWSIQITLAQATASVGLPTFTSLHSRLVLLRPESSFATGHVTSALRRAGFCWQEWMGRRGSQGMSTQTCLGH